jgi:hypothetical protein
VRIIFVGVHNKPFKKPLDSRTSSGKRIDKIISHLPNLECEKMNLFNLPYLPKGGERLAQIDKFFQRAELDPTDILVTLGYEVHRALLDDPRVPCKTLSVLHPSLQYQKITESQYIHDVVSKIKTLLSWQSVNSVAIKQ